MYSVLTPVNLIFIAGALFLVQRLYTELTTGARRRRMIAEHGCKPAYRYPHKGIMGKAVGLDVMKDMIKSGKEGRMGEASRIRNFSGGRYTLEQRRLLGDMVVTIEPENIKTVSHIPVSSRLAGLTMQILATKFPDYVLGDTRTATFMPMFGHGIFDTDGAAWERSRGLIRPNFVRAQVADLDMFESHVQHLISNVPRDGSTIDLQDQFFSLTMDSATEFLFGHSTNTLVPGLGSKEAHEFVKAFVYCTERISVELRSFGVLRWIPNSTNANNIKTIHRFADGVVKEALDKMDKTDLAKDLASGKAKYTFLYELISRTRDPYTLRSELLNVLLAGRDTTAGLLSNTWVVLTKRPDILAKLRAEVDELGGEKPDYQQLKDMKYLKYLLNESLRLMPVVPGNSRQAIRDTVLPLGGGPDQKSPILVKKGQVVAYQPWSMHRRFDYWGEDALEFKPERWATARPGWEYLPFNGGPRICVGQQYALLEASYVTVRLLQKFPRIESRDGREWREWMTITLSSGIGCKVAMFEK